MQTLTSQDLLAKAPAIFSQTASSEVSSKYVYIPTHTLVSDFEKTGWSPVAVQQRKAWKRREGENKFSMHKVVLAPTSQMDIVGQGITPNLLLFNSHNRSFPLKIKLGLFRVICKNGLVTCDSDMGELSIRHKGHTFEEIQSLVFDAVEKFKTVASKIDDYKNINLTTQNKNDFAMKVMQVVWGNNQKLEIAQLLNPKRDEDKADDLWTVFNTLQENVTKGGMIYQTGKDKIRHTKKVKGIMADYKINSNLWFLMEAFRTTRRF